MQDKLCRTEFHQLHSSAGPPGETSHRKLAQSKERGKGLQFIAIQTSPEEQAFAGFWMMRDIATL